MSTSTPSTWRGTGRTLLVSTVARALLGTLALLLLVSVAPTVAGWETTVVMTGSMEPGVAAGDVAVIRPVHAPDRDRQRRPVRRPELTPVPWPAGRLATMHR